MRLIGHVPSELHGKKFQRFMQQKGIETSLDVGRDEQWQVWALDEDQIAEAAAQLSRFLAAPNDKVYEEVSNRTREAPKPSRGKIVDARVLFGGTRLRAGPLTIGLVGLSVLVTLFSGFGANEEVLAPFMISNVSGTGLPEVMRGEIWRLLTPIFGHGSPMHIIFNMLWLWDLGAMIESRKGSLTLALLVVGIGVLSNLGQYFMSGPSFFGMSGVVYGLLGYAWMHSKFAPWEGLLIRQDTVWMMIAWFFVCLFGVVGNIANGAHAVGFGVGIAWGYVSAQIIAHRR